MNIKELKARCDFSGIDFSEGRAIGTICEHNDKGQYRMCAGYDQGIKLSDWRNTYELARWQAMEVVKDWKELGHGL